MNAPITNEGMEARVQEILNKRYSDVSVRDIDDLIEIYELLKPKPGTIKTTDDLGDHLNILAQRKKIKCEGCVFEDKQTGYCSGCTPNEKNCGVGTKWTDDVDELLKQAWVFLPKNAPDGFREDEVNPLGVVEFKFTQDERVENIIYQLEQLKGKYYYNLDIEGFRVGDWIGKKLIIRAAPEVSIDVPEDILRNDRGCKTCRYEKIDKDSCLCISCKDANRKGGNFPNWKQKELQKPFSEVYPKEEPEKIDCPDCDGYGTSDQNLPCNNSVHSKKEEPMPFTQSNDAMVWAREFMAHIKRNNWTIADIDEALMVGWFANYRSAVESIMEKEVKMVSTLKKSCETCEFGGEGVDMVDRCKQCNLITRELKGWKEKGSDLIIGV